MRFAHLPGGNSLVAMARRAFVGLLTAVTGVVAGTMIALVPASPDLSHLPPAAQADAQSIRSEVCPPGLSGTPITMARAAEPVDASPGQVALYYACRTAARERLGVAAGVTGLMVLGALAIVVARGRRLGELADRVADGLPQLANAEPMARVTRVAGVGVTVLGLSGFIGVMVLVTSSA